MKRILAFLLAGIIMLSAAACGTKDNGDKHTADNTDNEIVNKESDGEESNSEVKNEEPGKFELVKDVYPFENDIDKSLLLRLTASAESYSEHPLAKAITAYAKEENVKLFEVEDFYMVPGKGISAVIRGEKLFCGNARF